MKDDRVLLGEIVGPQALHGHFRIKTYTESPENITSYGVLYDDQGEPFPLDIIRQKSDSVLIAKSSKVSGRDAAEKAKGIKLYVDRSQLPDVEDGEVYYDDLVGLKVEGANGVLIGSIKGLYNVGSGDVVDIETNNGLRTLLYNDDSVLSVDITSDNPRLVINTDFLL